MMLKCRVARWPSLAALPTLVAAGAATFSADPSRAEPIPYFLDGQVRSLDRSNTEFAIELLPGDGPAAADARCRRIGWGRVAPLPWGRPDGRFAILTVPSADAETATQVLSLGLARSVAPVYRFVEDGLPHIGTGRIAIKFSDELSDADRCRFFADMGVSEIGPLEGVEAAWLGSAISGEDDTRLAARIALDPRVEFAEPDLVSPLRLAQIIINPDDISDFVIDPLFAEQWHLQNTGQDGGVIGSDLNVVSVWQLGILGDGVVVGMLDDACDLNHEDLVANYTSLSHNAATGQKTLTAANPAAAGQKHGTAMMGLICAELNSTGVVGVAPRARFTVSSGADSALSNSQIANAFKFATDRNVDVHCNSWAGETGAPVSSTLVNAIDDAFEDGRSGFGMVFVFPAGNDGVEAALGSSLAAAQNSAGQKIVIGVGACNARDRVASYSNFGAGVDVVAPSSDFFLPQLVTTDNTDDAGLGDAGYNSNGLDAFGQPNLSNARYTQGDGFSDTTSPDVFGTSAAAAQVAGVAALILSISEQSGSPAPTATQVRSIIEHTAVKIPLSNPDEGDYNVITGRSQRYGYGRVDVEEAIRAALLMTASSPFAWPERVKNVRVDTRSDVLSWDPNDDVRVVGGVSRGDTTTGILVVQRTGRDFEWAPTDGETYFTGETVDGLQDVRVVQNNATDEFEFDDSRGVLYFGIFARNAAGRYSFGVSVNSLGQFTETGSIPNTGGNTNDNDNGGPSPGSPTVAIQVSPLSGLSPLTVSFRGNAPESDSPIESMVWDFGDGSAPVNQSVVEHTYTLTGTDTQTFEAAFTVTDEDGDSSRRNVLITVFSADAPGEIPVEGQVRIVVQRPGSSADVGSSVLTGELLQFSFESSTADLDEPQTAFWSLGDGSTSSSFTVLHSYDVAGTFPISLSLTIATSSGTNIVLPASRLITITQAPNANDNSANDNVAPPSNGGDQGGVCGLGMIMPLAGVFGLAMMRRLKLAPR